MFCSNCGARLEDDAAFCTECGARVMRDLVATQSLAPGQAPSPTLDQTQPVSPETAPLTRMPAVIPPAPVDPASRRRDPRPTQRETRESKERLVVAAGLVGVLIVAGVAGYFLGVHLPTRKAPAAQATQAEPGTAASAPSVDRSVHAVKISVKSEGWNTDAAASKLPVHVEGADVDGNAVSTTASSIPTVSALASNRENTSSPCSRRPSAQKVRCGRPKARRRPSYWAAPYVRARRWT